MPEVPRSLILVGDYSSLATQGVVNWYDDDFVTPGMNEDDAHGLATEIAYLTRPGYRIGDVFFGDDRGRIFMEDEDETFSGESVIVPAHLIMGDAGGDDDEGKLITRAWSYAESEHSAWAVRVWSGDERAYPPFSSNLNLIRQLKPEGGDAVSASELLDVYPRQVGAPPPAPVYDTRAQPKTVHVHKPAKGIAGRGFSFEFRFSNPRGVHFYGFGFVHEPGRTSRPLVEATRIEPISAPLPSP